MRPRASSMSANVGAARVAKFEYLLHYLSDGGQRIELAPLHLVEEPPQLRISLDRALQVCLGPARSDGEYLAGEVLAAPLLEAPVRLEMRAVLRDLLPEDIDV